MPLICRGLTLVGADAPQAQWRRQWSSRRAAQHHVRGHGSRARSLAAYSALERYTGVVPFAHRVLSCAPHGRLGTLRALSRDFGWVVAGKTLGSSLFPNPWNWVRNLLRHRLLFGRTPLRQGFVDLQHGLASLAAPVDPRNVGHSVQAVGL